MSMTKVWKIIKPNKFKSVSDSIKYLKKKKFILVLGLKILLKIKKINLF